jgi:hypothetical protein
MTTTLKFYADAALTTALTTRAINHLIDGSSDPQDFVFYLGSTTANKFRNLNDPDVANLAVEITNITPLWTAATAFIVNDRVRTTAKNGYQYRVQSIAGAGLTGGSEPVWPTTIGNTVVDNQVTWITESKIHESTEIKLALSNVGLDSATAGASLVIGTLINGGSLNAVPIHMRIDDATAIIGQISELGLLVRDTEESPI